MATLLHLDASPLETSISRELAREFVSLWRENHPNSSVRYRDLSRSIPSPIDQNWVGSSFTPADARTPEQLESLKESDELVDELLSADEIVIGVPMHNFSIPSSLKLWIDQIVRPGRTFQSGSKGLEGLVKGKKATLLVATGGDYTKGPAASYNFVEPYLRTVLGFIGITDVRVHTVGGVSKLNSGSVDRQTLLQPALEQIRALAA